MKFSLVLTLSGYIPACHLIREFSLLKSPCLHHHAITGTMKNNLVPFSTLNRTVHSLLSQELLEVLKLEQSRTCVGLDGGQYGAAVKYKLFSKSAKPELKRERNNPLNGLGTSFVDGSKLVSK